jgi:adenosylcobinamide kinase/adenosylcobinamide-phosphate guanylyltransferase
VVSGERPAPSTREPASITLIGGGVRSGKSALALRLCRARGERRVFIATAEAHDDEMAARIARHQEERGAAFRTHEVPLDLPEALAALSGVDGVVIDCLTLWLSNLLGAGLGDDHIAARVDDLCASLQRRAFDVFVVTNEVGLGVVPPSPVGRRFRDLTGRAHQQLAAISDQVFFAALGVTLRLRPGPVEVIAP